MKLKVASGFEITITEGVADELSLIIKNLFMSVSDNYVISNKETFSKAYEMAKQLFLFRVIKKP